MNPGILRESITIQRRAPASPDKSSIGEDDYAWASFHVTRARIRTARNKEQVVAGAEEANIEKEITIRYYPGITTAMRVLHGSVYYDIRGVDNQDERNRVINLLCTGGNSLG